MMNMLYDYVNRFAFFTMTKPAFIVWIFLVLFMLFLAAAALICHAFFAHWMMRYLYGKSAEDTKVQDWVADNNMREDICSIVAIHSGLLAVCTIATFFVANYHFVAGVVAECVCAFLLILLCTLSIIGSREFTRDLKNGTVNY